MRKGKLMGLLLLVLLLLAWAPWMDERAIHDRILREKGLKDGSVVPVDYYREQYNVSEEVLERLVEESRKKGIEEGIIICDYRVMWFPFGRWVASCEGGYYVGFWSELLRAGDN
ncbi:hypothetical protein [Candidatus Pyrohabitans sp.]